MFWGYVGKGSFFKIRGGAGGKKIILVCLKKLILWRRLRFVALVLNADLSSLTIEHQPIYLRCIVFVNVKGEVMNIFSGFFIFVLIFVSANMAYASDVELYCQGVATENGLVAGTDDLVVIINPEEKHLKVFFGQKEVIDNTMEIRGNEYFYVLLNKNATQVYRLFSINRSNLDYRFGYYIGGIQVYRQSKGRCKKIEQQI